MKREQADKLCTDGVGGWLGELDCSLSLPHWETWGLIIYQRRQMYKSTQVLGHCFCLQPPIVAQITNEIFDLLYKDICLLCLRLPVLLVSALKISGVKLFLSDTKNRCVSWRGTLEDRDKKDHYDCCVRQFITLITQHNLVVEGCSEALGRSLCQDLLVQVSNPWSPDLL